MVRKKEGPDTRERIIKAAEALFAEQGYDGTSTRQIAANAEISLQTLHYHCDDKSTLYNLVLERALAPVAHIIDHNVKIMAEVDLNDDQAFQVAINNVIEELFDEFHENPNFPLLLLRQWLEQNPNLRQVEWDLLVPAIMKWVSQVQKSMDPSRYFGIDLHLMFFSISWTYWGLLSNPQFLGELMGLDPDSREFNSQLKAHAKEMTARIMGGGCRFSRNNPGGPMPSPCMWCNRKDECTNDKI